ncbi:MAG: hypothetical protein GTO51_06385 [Candidatus Latescibacteria bacterium]|nr:hypothetical protein [Candidatus Latescibacterota bacterium]NIM21419.1 hypothetical protein [Candidatus Latescibacterota bacterium]NIM65600.1 hypothetical protein [Candidatus Latescibacterota bacterium]NIO01980.1 hypothetical protein [Candidatus Latescibacterota bacterium]NIO28792.1 hypothetical protein [Candidatus Latescibacterota bacterium]
MAKITVEELWDIIRGLENSYRYFSDILGALMQELPRGKDYPIEVSDDIIETLKGGWPRFCLPPLCRKALPDVVFDIKETGGKGGAAGEAVDALVKQLAEPPGKIRELDFYASEVPGTRWPDKSAYK